MPVVTRHKASINVVEHSSSSKNTDTTCLRNHNVLFGTPNNEENTSKEQNHLFISRPSPPDIKLHDPVCLSFGCKLMNLLTSKVHLMEVQNGSLIKLLQSFHG
jgi:hypothetical protein